ncbi:mage family protein [Zymoseptoria brevis]|uniref:Mage family protein n=1 Tax=Zymoseptoria brevis TaxID=1047168 RepID=A0A0F4GQ60_9PEZI|nr:mage family protein [Zymoseptoria brevis]
MPVAQGRKRRSDRQEDVEDADASPEPQTQRRRTQHEDDEDDFAQTQGGENVEDMAKKLVRLALACEYQRRPIRRAEIGDKVLGTHGRKFKEVWSQAQRNLNDVFGMEMVELPVKEKVTLQQRRAANKSQSGASKPTPSWIVTSILPPKFRNPDIINPPSAPTPDHDATYTAIYTLLISLISLSGGNLPDAKMERFLTKMGMRDNTPVQDYEKTEKLQKRLEKDGYIVKIKESTGTGEDDVYWLVGPRGKIEVGDEGVRGLTEAVYGNLGEVEAEELHRKIERSLGIGERPPEKTQAPQNGEKSKRGRKKKPVQEPEQEDEEEDDGEESSDQEDE